MRRNGSLVSEPRGGRTANDIRRFHEYSVIKLPLYAPAPCAAEAFGDDLQPQHSPQRFEEGLRARHPDVAPAPDKLVQPFPALALRVRAIWMRARVRQERSSRNRTAQMRLKLRPSTRGQVRVVRRPDRGLYPRVLCALRRRRARERLRHQTSRGVILFIVPASKISLRRRSCANQPNTYHDRQLIANCSTSSSRNGCGVTDRARPPAGGDVALSLLFARRRARPLAGVAAGEVRPGNPSWSGGGVMRDDAEGRS